MKSTGESLAVGIALLAVALGLSFCHCSVMGCIPQPTIPAYCTNEVAFTAALVRCVDQSETRDASRECRAAVHERCGITMTTSSRSLAP